MRKMEGGRIGKFCSTFAPEKKRTKQGTEFNNKPFGREGRSFGNNGGGVRLDGSKGGTGTLLGGSR